MQISEDQIKKYIEIQQKVRNIILTKEEAIKETSDLLVFAKTVIAYQNKKNIKKTLKNK